MLFTPIDRITYFPLFCTVFQNCQVLIINFIKYKCLEHSFILMNEITLNYILAEFCQEVYAGLINPVKIFFP